MTEIENDIKQSTIVDSINEMATTQNDMVKTIIKDV